MFGFLENLDSLHQTFWYIAIPVSIIFIIQTILTFIGADGADGVEADFDGDLDGGDAPFQLFSLRNLINFLIGFSWTGVLFYTKLENKTILVLLATVVGAAFLFFFFLLIRQIMKLSEDNTFRLENTMNKVGSVYLSIPEERSGTGKVQVSVNGTTHELDAITSGERIPSGNMVKIIGIESGKLLIVEKL